MNGTETNCLRFRKLWQDEIDGSGHSPAVTSHMESCGSCRTWARDMGALLSDLDELRALTDSVVSAQSTAPQPAGRIEGNIAATPGRRRSRWWLPAAAALAASIVLPLLLTSGGDQPAQLADGLGSPRNGAVPDEDDATASVAHAGAGGAETQRPVLERNELPAGTGITLRGRSDSQLMAVAQSHEVPGVAVYLLYQRVPRSASAAKIGGS